MRGKSLKIRAKSVEIWSKCLKTFFAPSFAHPKILLLLHLCSNWFILVFIALNLDLFFRCTSISMFWVRPHTPHTIETISNSAADRYCRNTAEFVLISRNMIPSYHRYTLTYFQRCEVLEILDRSLHTSICCLRKISLKVSFAHLSCNGSFLHSLLLSKHHMSDGKLYCCFFLWHHCLF